MSLDFPQKLQQGFAKMLPGHQLPDEASCERLERYFHELKKWSRKVNLIAKQTSDEQLVENHFLDSLALLPWLRETEHPRLLDIGTGAGFPGLVCKAAFPELGLVLVEPRQKRANFLRHMVRTLGLDKTEVLCCRIEDEETLASNEVFSHITCRAVAELGVVVQMAERFRGGKPRLVYLKGPKWKEELAAAQKESRDSESSNSSFTVGESLEYELPFSGAQRSLVFFTSNGDSNEN